MFRANDMSINYLLELNSFKNMSPRILFTNARCLKYFIFFSYNDKNGKINLVLLLHSRNMILCLLVPKTIVLIFGINSYYTKYVIDKTLWCTKFASIFGIF